MTTPPLTKEEREKIRELAKVATPGPWRTFLHSDIDMFSVSADSSELEDSECTGLADCYNYTALQDSDNAEYIASANPGVMLALLDQIDALESTLKAIAAPDYSDEETFALNRFHNGDRWAAFQLHAFAKKAKAAIDAALQAEEPK